MLSMFILFTYFTYLLCTAGAW